MVKESMSKYLRVGDYERHRYSLVAGFFKDRGGAFLDIGCGYGGLARFLGSRFEYYGVDGIETDFPNYHRVDLNDKKLPFKDGYFDGICCCATLEHLFYPLEILRELKRLLKNDGRVLLSLPNDQGLNTVVSAFKKVGCYDDSVCGHHWKFSIETAREFFCKEFEIISEQPEFGPYYRKYLFWLKFKRLCTEWFIFGKKPR